MIGTSQVDADPFRVVGGLADNRKRRLRTPERQPESRGLDTGQGADALQEFLRKAVARVECRVLGRRQRNTDDQYAIDVDSRVHVLKDEERASGQTSADEQHDRQRDLDDHQEIARAATVCLGARAPACPERVGDICFRRLQRGDEAKHNAGHHRDSERKQQDGHVDRDTRLVRHVELGHEAHDRADRAEGEQDTQDSADEGEQHAFREELTHQLAASSANRHPDRHLPRARGPASQLQIGDVGAGDEQKERDRAEQQPQAVPHLTARDRDIQVVAQRRRKALSGERRGLLERQAIVQSAQLLFGDGLRDTRRQTHDRSDKWQVGPVG